MEANYKIRNGQITIKVEGATAKELFKALAELEDTFSVADDCCGSCGNIRTRFRVRTNKDGDSFYELFCLKCNATLDYGQKKDNKTIYPKRKDGWSVYQKAEEPNV